MPPLLLHTFAALATIRNLDVINRLDAVDSLDEFRPDPRQQLQWKHVLPRNQSARGILNRNSERNGDWALTAGPSANISSMCTNRPAQRGKPSAFLGEVSLQVHAHTIAMR